MRKISKKLAKKLWNQIEEFKYHKLIVNGILLSIKCSVWSDYGYLIEEIWSFYKSGYIPERLEKDLIGIECHSLSAKLIKHIADEFGVTFWHYNEFPEKKEEDDDLIFGCVQGLIQIFPSKADSLNQFYKSGNFTKELFIQAMK